MGKPADVPLPPGAVVGPYVIDGVAGVGPDHLTYRAVHQSTGRVLALKEFKPAARVVRAASCADLVPRDPADAGRFAELVARIGAQTEGRERFRHPNVIAIFDHIAQNGTAYLAMDRYDGQPLADLLGPGEALDRTEIDEILPPILDGLEALHGDGLLHLDLRPASIFIRRDGRPMLGRATLHPADLSAEDGLVAPAANDCWCAQEQFFSEAPIGPWTDIYGLAATLYRLTTGEAPANAIKRIKECARGDADPVDAGLDAVAARWQPELIAALKAGLRIEHSDRPGTIDDFRALIGGDPASKLGVTAGAEPDDGGAGAEPATMPIERRATPPPEAGATVRPAAEPEQAPPAVATIYRNGAPVPAPANTNANGAAAVESDEAAPTPPRLTALTPALDDKSWRTLSFYLHEPGTDSWVAMDRSAASGCAASELGAGAGRSRPREARNLTLRDAAPVTIVPQCDGAAFNPRQVVLDWHEAVQRIEFRVRRTSPSSALGLSDDGPAGHIHVFVGPILVGDLPVTFPEAGGEPVRLSADGFARVYLCHPPDDATIAGAIDAAVPFLNMPFIGECAALRGKAEWDRAVFRKIEAAEAFVVYWSDAASSSPRLRKEWEFAAALERDGFFHALIGHDEAVDLPPGLAPGDGVHCVNW